MMKSKLQGADGVFSNKKQSRKPQGRCKYQLLSYKLSHDMYLCIGGKRSHRYPMEGTEAPVKEANQVLQY